MVRCLERERENVSGREGEKMGEEQSESSFIYWFSSQNPATAMAVLNYIWVSIWGARTQARELSLAASQYISRKLEGKWRSGNSNQSNIGCNCLMQ